MKRSGGLCSGKGLGSLGVWTVIPYHTCTRTDALIMNQGLWVVCFQSMAMMCLSKPKQLYIFFLLVQITFSLIVWFELKERNRVLLLQNVISLPVFCFSNHGYNLSPTLRSVTPPPAVDDMPRKCPQILDGQKADSGNMMGREIDVVGGAKAQSPLPLPDPDARYTFCLDDAAFPLT